MMAKILKRYCKHRKSKAQNNRICNTVGHTRLIRISSGQSFTPFMSASNTMKLYRAVRQRVKKGNYLRQIPAVYSNITQSQTLIQLMRYNSLKKS